MALPLPLRNCLAGLILGALHDSRARDALRVLAGVCDDPERAEAARLPPLFPPELLESGEHGLHLQRGWQPHADELCERVRRAERMLAATPLAPAGAGLEAALGSARGLFDAHLYFEVHELLEPYWVSAEGRDRETIQGLIQAAVALEHLANGNVRGARSLLGDAIPKLQARTLAGLALDPFARGLGVCLDALHNQAATSAFDWTLVPPFPCVPPATRAAGARDPR